MHEDIHKSSPAKIPAWSEEGPMKSHHQLTAAKGKRRLSFTDVAPENLPTHIPADGPTPCKSSSEWPPWVLFCS